MFRTTFRKLAACLLGFVLCTTVYLFAEAADDFPPQVMKSAVHACQRNCQSTFENGLKSRFSDTVLQQKRPAYQPPLTQYCLKSCQCTFSNLSKQVPFKEYAQFEQQMVTPGATPNQKVHAAILDCSKGCAAQHHQELEAIKSKFQP